MKNGVHNIYNENAEAHIESILPLSHIFKKKSKGFFMMVQQQYDDELIKLSYMYKVSQELTVILPILPLLLGDRLGIYSSYTIGTEEYQ